MLNAPRSGKLRFVAAKTATPQRTAAPRRIAASVGAALVLAAIGITTIAPAATAATQTDDQLLIALDISGSMKEPDGNGDTKINAAKRALGNAVDAVPSNAQVGLRTYGGGCTQSSLVAPIKQVDKTAIKSAITSQQAAGDTPIAYALQQAAKDFDTSGRKNILLVSDGEETCGGDPVAEAKRLKDSGIGLCVDVVGFRVDSATREQLGKIANAACGRYYDAQDGKELNSRLQRASVRALRPYRADGTPVTGSSDGLNPPVLKPGTYRDVMPPNTAAATTTPGSTAGKPSRWYAVEVPDGAIAHIAATVPWSAPLGQDSTLRLGLKTYTASNSFCQSDTGFYAAEGGSISVDAQLTQRANDTEKKPGNCGRGGRYLVEVHNAGDELRDAEAPLELVVIIEPKATDVSDLPEAATEEDKPVKPRTFHTSNPIVGSGSYGDAPVLESGSFRDMLRPGEDVYYRVPVNYGQRVAAELKLPQLSAENDVKLGNGTSVRFRIVGPDREVVSQSGSSYYSGNPDSLNVSSVPVRYRNSESKDTTVSQTVLPGYYYIGLYMEPDVDDPYFELPINLNVEVKGKVMGRPAFKLTDGLVSPERQLKISNASAFGEPTSGESSSGLGDTLLWIGVTTGGVLLLGGVVATALLLRRRPQPGMPGQNTAGGYGPDGLG